MSLTVKLTVLKEVKFDEDDPENPKAWSRRKKLANVAVIASMSGKTVAPVLPEKTYRLT